MDIAAVCYLIKSILPVLLTVTVRRGYTTFICHDR